jgi:hypothetical protein
MKAIVYERFGPPEVTGNLGSDGALRYATVPAHP